MKKPVWLEKEEQIEVVNVREVLETIRKMQEETKLLNEQTERNLKQG